MEAPAPEDASCAPATPGGMIEGARSDGNAFDSRPLFRNRTLLIGVRLPPDHRVRSCSVSDETITPETAATLHAEAIARRELPAWIVFRDEPDYPGKVIARFVIDTPTTSVLVADTLTELRAMLPPRLTVTERRSADPLDVVEMWFDARDGRR